MTLALLLLLVAQAAPPAPAPQATTLDSTPSAPLAPGGPASGEEESAPAPLEGPFQKLYEEAVAELAQGGITEAATTAARLAVPDAPTLWHEDLRRTTGGLSERLFRPAAPTLRALGWAPRSRGQRAAARHLEGLARHRDGDVDGAEAAWQAARGLSSGPAALAACDALAAVDLAAAEELFQQIPEVQGVTQNALAPNFRSSSNETQEDPLPPARAKYLEARAHLVDRLRADWRDADARANAELVQRRLRRLDEIEQERRQEEGQERSDEDSSENESSDSSDSSDQGSETSDEQEQQDQEPEDSQDQDSEGEGDSQDGEEEPQDEQEEAEGGDEGEEDAEPQERLLTKEEQQRLLDQLRRHNLKGQELREQLARLRARGTDKDW